MKTMAQIIGLEAARKVFSSECGRIEQANAQRTPLSPIEYRRIEWEAVKRIIQAYLDGIGQEPSNDH